MRLLSITFVVGVIGMASLTAVHKTTLQVQTYVPAEINYQQASQTR